MTNPKDEGNRFLRADGEYTTQYLGPPGFLQEGVVMRDGVLLHDLVMREPIKVDGCDIGKHNLVNGGEFYICSRCHREFDDTGKLIYTDAQLRVLRSFEYHKPDDETIKLISVIRKAHIQLARVIIRTISDSEDCAVALRKVHESMMTCNKELVNRQ
jgi:hypothetical protein